MKKRPHFLFLAASLKDDPYWKAVQENDPQHKIFVNDVFLPLFATDKDGNPSFNTGDLSKFKHIMLKGSSQSGKSAVMALLFLWLAMYETKSNLLYILARPLGTLIRRSQFKDIEEVCKTCQWRGTYFQWNDSLRDTPIIKCLVSGIRIEPLGLDDSQKITSIKNGFNPYSSGSYSKRNFRA